MAYDLIVIGAGPGGYVCAVRAAQLGLKTAIVEKRATLGGTCLNVGCIPSKALLHASELFEEAGHSFKTLGIDIPAPVLNLPQMMNHKTETVASNVNGVEYLFKKNKITAFRGIGSIAAPGKVLVTPQSGPTQTIETKTIVIATGSVSANLPGIEIDEKQIVTSTGAIALDKVPERMLVIGAGVIGLELGSVWNRLGSKVTVVEFLDRIIPGMDGEIAKSFQRILEKQGFEFKLGAKVTGVDSSGKTLKVTIEPAAGGKSETLETDVVLVAIGRTPYTDGLGLKEAGVELDQRGRIKTDAHLATNVKGIYAIGDCIAGPMLAHKASHEGLVSARVIAGKSATFEATIPAVIFTDPEIAWCGLTEEAAKEKGEIKVGKFPMLANSRAKTNHEPDGFVKVISDAKTDRVLGVWCIASVAGTMIAQAAQAMEFGATSEDIAYTCHAHPTHSEALKEAAMAVAGKPIHM